MFWGAFESSPRSWNNRSIYPKRYSTNFQTSVHHDKTSFKIYFKMREYLVIFITEEGTCLFVHKVTVVSEKTEK